LSVYVIFAIRAGRSSEAGFNPLGGNSDDTEDGRKTEDD
jgi:hypothetical protein